MVLNAGGAVTRTILGAPDLWTAGSRNTDYIYFDYQAFSNLVDKGRTESSARQIIRDILENNERRDSESDRYTYNVSGKTGEFRYSFKDEEYILMNHSTDYIWSEGKGMESKFHIMASDGTEYMFGTHEQSGVDTYGEGNPYTTAWNVDSISKYQLQIQDWHHVD